MSACEKIAHNEYQPRLPPVFRPHLEMDRRMHQMLHRVITTGPVAPATLSIPFTRSTSAP